ncbi:MAG: S8 family peptidase [Lachnospira sp.]|nr:S8 family peptidase [Lachnospira sp.]
MFRNSAGNSKIAVLWDQTFKSDTVKDVNVLSNSVPYGELFFKEDIDRILADIDRGEEPQEQSPEIEKNGHGTYVASLAIGAAPEAELVIVRLKPAKKYLRDFFLINDSAEAFEESDIMIGVRYLLEYSRSVDKPMVILLGLGTGSGPRTGATPLGNVLNSVAAMSNIVVVTAMGNEANTRGHVKGVAESETNPYTIELNVGNAEKGFVLEIWANTLDVLSVSIVSPSGESNPRIPAKEGETTKLNFILEKSKVEINYQVVESISGYELIFIKFIKPASGIWKINVYSLTNILGSFNAWLPIKAYLSGDTYMLRSIPDTTLTEISADSRVISVGSYNHVTGAVDIDSGRGYAALGWVKPELVAPGINVYGAKSGGGYTYRSGTSAAAAIVAGASALLLCWGVYYENEILLGNNEIKYILIRGAVRRDTLATDTFEEYPNPVLGYGKMNLFNSFIQLRVT